MSFGGVTSILTDFCFRSPFTVADTVNVPDLVNGRRQVLVGESPVFGTNRFHEQGVVCVPNESGTHRTESMLHGLVTRSR